MMGGCGGGDEESMAGAALRPRAYPACLLRSHAPLSSGTKGAGGVRRWVGVLSAGFLPAQE